MAYVKQKARNDCGVAALAMLCNVSYETAYRAIPWRKKGILDGIDTKMIRTGAAKLGYTGLGTEKHQLKRITGCSWAKKRSWHTIPENSLVKIPAPHDGWHWVVWRKGKIHDPARGTFKPEKHGGVPYSYMQFVLDLHGGS